MAVQSLLASVFYGHLAGVGVGTTLAATLALTRRVLVFRAEMQSTAPSALDRAIVQLELPKPDSGQTTKIEGSEEYYSCEESDEDYFSAEELDKGATLCEKKQHPLSDTKVQRALNQIALSLVEMSIPPEGQNEAKVTCLVGLSTLISQALEKDPPAPEYDQMRVNSVTSFVQPLANGNYEGVLSNINNALDSLPAASKSSWSDWVKETVVSVSPWGVTRKVLTSVAAQYPEWNGAANVLISALDHHQDHEVLNIIRSRSAKLVEFGQKANSLFAGKALSEAIQALPADDKRLFLEMAKEYVTYLKNAKQSSAHLRVWSAMGKALSSTWDSWAGLLQSFAEALAPGSD